MAESQTRKVINFYSTAGEYGCFSNFSKHSVFLKERRWPTSEHYFQAQKFAGTEHEEAVRRCKTAREAANMGRSRKLPLRRDWESVKDQIMLEALRAKFTQHEELKETLLGTGDALLVEHTENNLFHIHRELQHGEAVEVGTLDDVGYVTVDKHFSREQADDLIGRHATIRTADPQVAGGLLPREFPEKRWVGLADVSGPGAIIGKEAFQRAHDFSNFAGQRLSVCFPMPSNSRSPPEHKNDFQANTNDNNPKSINSQSTIKMIRNTFVVPV